MKKIFCTATAFETTWDMIDWEAGMPGRAVRYWGERHKDHDFPSLFVDQLAEALTDSLIGESE